MQTFNINVIHTALALHKTKSCLASANTSQDVIFKGCIVLVMSWDSQGLKTGGGCWEAAFNHLNG